MLTVGMATRNRPHHLAAWLTHIATISGGDRVPIIVVDQSDEPSSLRMAANVSYVHRPGKGLAIARNLIIATAQTAAVAFCDDDCRPAHDWLVVGTNLIAEHPDVMVWFGTTFPSGGDARIHSAYTHAGSTAWASRPDGYVCQALRPSTQSFVTQEPCAILELLGQGNNMLVRITPGHSFEPLLGAGAIGASGEDVEYTLRMLCTGFSCAYDTRLVMIHDAWMTPGVSARAGHAATIGMLAAHVWYAWYGNHVARNEVAFRLRLRAAIIPAGFYASPQLKHECSWYIRELYALVWGCMLGCWLAIRRGTPWQQ